MLSGNSGTSKNKGTSLWNFATKSGLEKFRHCKLAVWSTKVVDGRAHCGWIHKVYYTLVDCNPPSITSMCSRFLVQLVPRLSSSSWQNFDRVIASHLLKRQIKTGKRLLNLDPDYFAKNLISVFCHKAVKNSLRLSDNRYPSNNAAWSADPTRHSNSLHIKCFNINIERQPSWKNSYFEQNHSEIQPTVSTVTDNNTVAPFWLKGV